MLGGHAPSIPTSYGGAQHHRPSICPGTSLGCLLGRLGLSPAGSVEGFTMFTLVGTKGTTRGPKSFQGAPIPPRGGNNSLHLVSLPSRDSHSNGPGIMATIDAGAVYSIPKKVEAPARHLNTSGPRSRCGIELKPKTEVQSKVLQLSH